MNVLERVIEVRVRKTKIVIIDSIQFGVMAGRSTTDAIFIVRQLQEKYLHLLIYLLTYLLTYLAQNLLLWIWRKHLIGCLGRQFVGH